MIIRRAGSFVALLLFSYTFVCFGQAPVRVAIVGLEHGHIAGFLEQFPRQHDVQLVGIVEPDAALCAKYQRQFHLDPSLFFSRIPDVVAQRHPQMFLVYTPVGEHRRVIEQAASFGISAMVEKPLTLSLADALAIRQAAREHHIQVLVNYETTWYASNRAVLSMAQDGQLGEIHKIVVRDGHQGPQEIGVQPEFLKWLKNPAENGAGALYDFGCYGADLVTVLMHGAAPISVTAVAQTDKPEEYPHVDDDATIILRYPHAQAVLMPSWDWPFSRKDMEIYGTKGYAIAVDPTQIRVRLSSDSPEQTSTAEAVPPPFDSSLHYVAAVIDEDTHPKGDLTALDTNVIVMQILDAARQAVATGRTVVLQPLPQ